MATLWYSRDPGGEREVEVSFQSGWKETAVSYHGTPLSTIHTRQELEEGREFSLPDGGRLTIHLPKRFMPLPRVTLDGLALTMSAQNSRQSLGAAFQAVILIGIFNTTMGALALLGVGAVQRFGATYLHLAYGVLFLFLSFFVRRRSALALAAAVTLFGLDSLVWLYYYFHARGQQVPLLGLIMRAVFLIFMVRGFRAIRHTGGHGDEAR
ncbi:MAG TPA: hypothetical protein VG099_23350 [Gemmataceae bacterium]|jgi:hypothetical protein|nr:hypothetical protein [Gemmataceae bacterium]